MRCEIAQSAESTVDKLSGYPTKLPWGDFLPLSSGWVQRWLGSEPSTVPWVPD